MSIGEHQGTQQSGESSTDYAALYEEQHPVEDQDKARFMAEAEDVSHTNAKYYDSRAAEERKYDNNEMADRYEARAAQSRSEASNVGEQAGEAYDSIDDLTSKAS